MIARFVGDVTRQMGLDDKARYAVQLAVDEACTNVIKYAYDEKTGQPVTVECRKEDDNCVVVIRDKGRAFDPSNVPAPDFDSPVSERQEGGLGLYLMRTLMDDVRFRFDTPHGNELTLVKSLRGGPRRKVAARDEAPRKRRTTKTAGRRSQRAGED